MPDYDSRPDTLRHAQRVAELMWTAIAELGARSTCHDRSKTVPPEVEIFDEFTPRLQNATYGSPEYRTQLDAMGDGLAHHYAANRHHPEHFPNGINGMTLIDLIEMLADWKAASERKPDGDLLTSLDIQRDRFGISEQLAEVLLNTAHYLDWVTP